MNYRIELENRAVREFHSLPNEIAVRIEEAINALRHDPRPVGSKKLTAREGYRIRKGDYRILYVIDDKQRIVRVYRVGHRRDIYR